MHVEYIKFAIFDQYMWETMQDRGIFTKERWQEIICPLSNRNISIFSIAAPLVWNILPLVLRTANSLPAFKNNLKTFLFFWDFK